MFFVGKGGFEAIGRVKGSIAEALELSDAPMNVTQWIEKELFVDTTGRVTLDELYEVRTLATTVSSVSVLLPIPCEIGTTCLFCFSSATNYM